MLMIGFIVKMILSEYTIGNFRRLGRVLVTAGLLLASVAANCQADSNTGVENPVITAVHVEVIDFPDPEGIIRKFSRDLIPLEVGDRFSETLIDQSIRALRNTRRFDFIDVDSSEGDGQFKLHFKLTPFPLIKHIRFQNNYPLLEHKLLKAMTASVGDVFLPGLLPRQTEAIVQLYRNEGFIAPIVDIRPKVDPGDGNYTLYVDVDKGPYYRLTALNFSGNDSIGDLPLKRRMNPWQGIPTWGMSDRFVEKDFREDLKSLDQYYRKKGYAEADVHWKVHKDKNKAATVVDIEIDEGPLYKVEFKGNDGFSDRVLKRELVFFTEGNIRGRGERKSLENIQKRYRKAGFLEAEVRIESELGDSNGRPVRVIRFVIEEGPQTKVRDVQIKGNQSLTDEELNENVLTRPPGWFFHGGFSPERLKEDGGAIKLQYNRKGFLSADVQVETRFSPGRDEVEVIFHIKEGIQTFVDDVIFIGLTVMTPAETLDAMSLKPGAPYRETLVRSDENTLKSVVAEKGHPHVKVGGEHTLSVDRSRATLTYRIDEGPFVRLESIHYRGNFRTRPKVLDREWTFSPGDPFSPRKFSESQRNIRDLGVFTSVRSRALGFKEKQESVDLVVELEERKPYLFEVSGGYESDRRLFIGTKIADRNLGGMNRLGWVGGEVSEIGYRFETGLREPRLFASHVAAHMQGYVERYEGFNQNFGTDQAGATLGFDLRHWERVTTGLNIKYEYLNQFQKGSADSPGDILAADQLDPRNVLVTTPRILYDSRNSFIWPRKGIFSLGYVDISKGLDNELDNFLRYHLDLRYFWTPFNGLTFAFIGRGEFIDPYNQSGNVPKDQLIYLGGITDVRGFRQNAMLTDANGDAVGGQESLYGSIEARIGLGSNWEVPIFFDVGWLGGIQDPTVEEEGRMTVGTGLRYITPIGPIGILYGYKLDRKSDEDRGQFYFSLGYTF